MSQEYSLLADLDLSLDQPYCSEHSWHTGVVELSWYVFVIWSLTSNNWLTEFRLLGIRHVPYVATKDRGLADIQS